MAEAEFTRSGRRRKASYKQISEWVHEAWEEIPGRMIESSFDKCGIVDEDASHLFNHRLLELLTSGSLGELEENSTGLTDDELD